MSKVGSQPNDAPVSRSENRSSGKGIIRSVAIVAAALVLTLGMRAQRDVPYSRGVEQPIDPPGQRQMRHPQHDPATTDPTVTIGAKGTKDAATLSIAMLVIVGSAIALWAQFFWEDSNLNLRVLGILKIAGLTVALISGAVAAIMDLKDERGALTFCGKLNFGAILFGGFLAISAQSMENSVKQEETLASLRDIQRILHPLTHIRLGFRVRVDNRTPVAEQFLNSVSNLVNSLKDNSCPGQYCFPEKGVTVYNFRDNPTLNRWVKVDRTSSLIPSDNDVES